MDSISVIIPTYNEVDEIEQFLTYHEENFSFDEFIVADGGSEDGIGSMLRQRENVKLIELSGPSRGEQLQHAAVEAKGEWIFMFHVDTRLPLTFTPETFQPESRWGWFDCRLDHDDVLYRVIERGITIRSALFQTPTGDQTIWVHQTLLDEIGGIPKEPIMEDVIMVKQLRDRERGQRIHKPVTISARKWKREGPIRVVFMMWFFRLAHIFGASSEWIYRQYYGKEPSKNTVGVREA